MKMRTKTSRRERERGVALALALFAMAALMVGATSALFVGSDDIHAARNYRNAAQAHFAAESALSHAVQRINATGILNFETDVVTNWNNWQLSSAQNFALPGYSYTLTALVDATNVTDRGYLRATVTGPENVRNIATARVLRQAGNGTAPGAIYLVNDDPTNTDFQGNSFTVDGRDWNPDGTLAAGGKRLLQKRHVEPRELRRQHPVDLRRPGLVRIDDQPAHRRASSSQASTASGFLRR